MAAADAVPDGREVIEEVASERNFQALVRALERVGGAAIYIAECESPDFSHELTERLRIILQARDTSVVEVDLTGERNVLDAFRRACGEGSTVLAAFNLAKAGDEEYPLPRVLAAMNIQRELYRDTLSCPMIFWMERTMVAEMALKAPDFFDWRSGLYLFEYQPSVNARAMEAGRVLDAMPGAHRVPRPEARKRLEGLRDLLTDLRNAPPTPQNREMLFRVARRYVGLLYDCMEYREALKLAGDMLELARGAPARRWEAEFGVWAGSMRQALGDRTGAQDAYERALGIYRELATTEPTVFRPYLAMTLNNQGAVLAELGDCAGARKVYEEALGIHRELAATDQTASRNHMAGTLSNLGHVLQKLGDRAGARRALGEALSIYREWATTEPMAAGTGLATTLNSLGGALASTGDHAGARAALEDALRIYQDLAAAELGEAGAGLATTLNNLGATLAGSGDRMGARAAFREALNVYQFVPKQRADALADDIARTRRNLARIESEIGNHA